MEPEIRRLNRIELSLLRRSVFDRGAIGALWLLLPGSVGFVVHALGASLAFAEIGGIGAYVALVELTLWLRTRVVRRTVGQVGQVGSGRPAHLQWGLVLAACLVGAQLYSLSVAPLPVIGLMVGSSAIVLYEGVRWVAFHWGARWALMDAEGKRRRDAAVQAYLESVGQGA